MKHAPLLDSFGRVHTYLRLSVTDRCNYRCVYCMPEEGFDWLKKEKLLTYEEMTTLVRVFASLGIRHVRITGGEPTIRKDLYKLVAAIKQIPGIEEVSMTTNGQLFAKSATQLANAGLDRINISLDTLKEDRHREITRIGDLQKVLDAISLARAHGITPIKVNMVVMDGYNDDEVADLVAYFAPYAADVELRFIEHMPFGDSIGRHVPSQTIRDRLGKHYEIVKREVAIKNGPATTWIEKSSGLKLGFISPITEHFCATCNRLRLGCDGHLRTCLSRENAPSLRALVRGGANDDIIASTIRAMVMNKVEGHEAHLEGGAAFEGVMTAIGG
jgi:cyclic pyranopterin phosphate synthase